LSQTGRVIGDRFIRRTNLIDVFLSRSESGMEAAGIGLSVFAQIWLHAALEAKVLNLRPPKPQQFLAYYFAALER
jgi:hypothetical protein